MVSQQPSVDHGVGTPARVRACHQVRLKPPLFAGCHVEREFTRTVLMLFLRREIDNASRQIKKKKKKKNAQTPRIEIESYG